MDPTNSQHITRPLAYTFKLLNVQGNQTDTQGNKTHRENTVVNLSHVILTDTQRDVLDLGLQFIPTPKSDILPIAQAALKQFSRQIKLRYFFHGSKHTSSIKKCTGKSHWTPPCNNASIIEKLNDLETTILYQTNDNDTDNNISKEQLDALKSLRDNPEIVIKPADKGSATVIMSRNSYITEVNRQLANPMHYTSLLEPVYPEASRKITVILQQLKQSDYITHKQLDYLTPPSEPRHRQLYLLPKIHKSADKWPQKDLMPPGRPIISDCNSESYRVAQYIDSFLTPLSITHASYVKNTTDFLDKITSITSPANCILFTLDVESLYTNIDNTAGLASVKRAFDRTPDIDRPDKEIMELLEISLKYNDFKFNSDFYLQIHGTAMGKVFAPNYANIFMADWEEKALSQCNKLPTIYLRYLDDIFGIWTHGETEFNSFLTILNSQHPSIRLTSEISYESVNFLDTTIFKGDRFSKTGIVDSKVYFKPTDTHQLLHKESFHPKHTFSGILKSQILRFRRICNNKSDFESATTILFNSLRQRNYSARFLRSVKTQTLNNIINNNRKETATPCHAPNCHTCAHLIDFTPTAAPASKTNTCGTSNVVYLINCDICPATYIGETRNTLRTRLNQHRSDILHNTDTPVSIHFNLPNHCLANLRITILQSGPFTDTPTLETIHRRHAENKWMNQFRSPHRLNIKDIDANILPFVIPYSRQATAMSKLVRETYEEIQIEYPKVFTSRFITAYSRNKNIKDMIVSTTFK